MQKRRGLRFHNKVLNVEELIYYEYLRASSQRLVRAVKEERILAQGQTKQEAKTERHLKGKKLKDSLLEHKIRC